MLIEATQKAPRSRAFLVSASLGLALFGASFVQAQEPRSVSETGAAAPSGAAVRGIEKSDIRRGQMRDADDDGDGFGDAAPVARQADLKKLADELVNVQGPPANTDGPADHAAATKVDAGNGLNARSMNGRAGDPIPGIDITVNQGPGGSSGQVSNSSDPTAETVPALDPNPSL